METKKILFPLVIVVVVGAVVFALFNNRADAPTEQTANNTPVENSTTETVKEFTMTAYYDPTIQKPVYSLPEMNVKKGDKVRVKITNTMGMHDFVIDEFSVAKELPLNQEVVVEFTADKAGDFVYYCSKPGHKENGQWGTVKVTE